MAVRFIELRMRRALTGRGTRAAIEAAQQDVGQMDEQGEEREPRREARDRPREGTAVRAQGATADAAAAGGGALDAGYDDRMDAIFGKLIEKSWERHRAREQSSELD